MTLFLIHAFVITLLLVILTMSSYVDRLYSERGKFLSREYQENIDSWEKLVEPHLGMSGERAQLAAAIWAQLSLALLALYFGSLLFALTSPQDRPTAPEILQALFGVVLVILLFNRFFPMVFFTRTKGIWVARLRFPLRLLFYLVLPITLSLSFLQSIAALAQSDKRTKQEDASEGVDALIEAGEEEGILEESDRALVRSAVEFGDTIAREVMTPRPEMFAVPESMTLAQFNAALEQRPYSRVPVYRDSIDHITGIAFAHDLLRVPDTEASTRPLSTITRPVSFVPETKKGYELLREMQNQKQHMCIVIDEYGGVAGLVTIEDLLEEIVGNITDEHEKPALEDIAHREGERAWRVHGTFEVARLPELFGDTFRIERDHAATTVGGLVSEVAGRIPLPGEIVEGDGMRMEVLASTGRRVESVRLSLLVVPTETTENTDLPTEAKAK